MENIIIDVRGVNGRDALHDCFAQALRAPEWYGRNLDALHDLLGGIGAPTEVRFVYTEKGKNPDFVWYLSRVRRVLADAAAENPALRLECVEKKQPDKEALDAALALCHVQPVGDGYADCICPMEKAGEFIDALSALGVRVTGCRWWRLVRGGHEPCGMGGPQNRFGAGWYSELGEGLTEFPDNEALRNYLLNIYPASPKYRECRAPGFRLEVPASWRNAQRI